MASIDSFCADWELEGLVATRKDVSKTIENYPSMHQTFLFFAFCLQDISASSSSRHKLVCNCDLAQQNL